MAVDEKLVQRLVAIVQGDLLGAGKAKAALRVVGGTEVPDAAIGMDGLTRDQHYSRIRDLARMYWLAWLVRQETAHVGGVMECLSDDELYSLHEKMERARECRVEGIPFDDAGLVRSQGEVA